MHKRREEVAGFIDAARVLFESKTLPLPARTLASKVFARLGTPSDDGQRRPVQKLSVAKWLRPALMASRIESPPTGATIASAIENIEGSLVWQRRTTGANGSENYEERHANCMVCGPGCAESRSDVLLGFSLLAPYTRYPDHRHSPAEAYVLLTPGKFKQEDGDWFAPAVGGGLYNAPAVLHAMMSGSDPLLALFCLYL
jgi:hypothetical protein